jgi:hypothetical protein
MTDVMQEFKNKRFAIVEAALIDITDNEHLIILTEIEYWNEHYEELQSWCEGYGAEVRGMTVTCDESTLTLFCLRWA